MVQFLERFTDYPFLVKFKNSEYPIGEGEPTFTVNFKETIPLAELLKSTSLALGEAYMRGDLDIEGNLELYQKWIVRKAFKELHHCFFFSLFS